MTRDSSALRDAELVDQLQREAFGPDDGTIAPWAAVASLPFAPEVVLPTIRHMVRLGSGPTRCDYGLAASFNPTFPGEGKLGWVSPWDFGLNQGPIVLMIENWRSGLVWELTRRCSFLVEGLRRAGFVGGWLGSSPKQAPRGEFA